MNQSHVCGVGGALCRTFVLALALCLGFFAASGRAAVISAGTPTTTVPTYLTDGTYPPFGQTVTLATPPPTTQFLLPIQITGAVNLQIWQFDLAYDNTVVTAVDPGDGTSGIYGGQFVSGDPNSIAFILGGFQLSGLVDDVSGSYPSFVPTTGPTGDGVLAYLLFEFVPGQETANPGFRVDNPIVTEQVPAPGTLLLLIPPLVVLGLRRRLERYDVGVTQ